MLKFVQNGVILISSLRDTKVIRLMNMIHEVINLMLCLCTAINFEWGVGKIFIIIIIIIILKFVF